MGNSNWLTAEVVEQIQWAATSGRSVDSFVAALKQTTLAGLLEYGCLRRTLGALPMLPPSITASVLGNGLAEVASEIGIRTTGQDVPKSISHEPKKVEFVTVRDDSEMTSQSMEMLFMRFTQSTKLAGFPERTANELQAAFNEMIDNAVVHASSPIPVVAGYYVRPGIAQFVVADVGRGVLDTLHENRRFLDLKTDADAIQLALHDGVSRFADRGGFGFHPLFKALTEHWGVLRFRSKGGCWTMDGTHIDADHGVRHFPPVLPGFQVAVTCYANGMVLETPVV